MNRTGTGPTGIQIRSIIILILVHLLILLCFYGQIIFHPDQYMFGISGDGIKNYFTFAWHIKHGTGLMEFEGMNFPYGEHFLYTDGHPFFVAIFKILTKWNSWFTDYSIAILNEWLLLNSILCSLFLFLIFKWFKLESGIAILASIAITLLSPQVFRLPGHLALSYSYAIPCSIYLSLRILKGCKGSVFWLWVHGLFFLFTHAYLGMMAIGLPFLIFLMSIAFERDGSALRRTKILALIICLSAVIIFYLFLLWTDSHPDRTNNPAGFFLYNAELDDLLIPGEGPIRQLLDRISLVEIDLEWEARAYLGITGVFFFISIIILALFSTLFKRSRKRLYAFFHQRELNILLLASVFFLLFAFAFPFKQIRELIEFVPIFKNFRATGRFVWPFFYSFQIFFVVTLFQWKKKHGMKWNSTMKSVFVYLTLITLLLEGFIQQHIVSTSIKQYPNLLSKSRVDEFNGKFGDTIHFSKYQALISLPYFHHGSESFDRIRHDEAMRNTMRVSYYTGLPMVNANLTRVSIPESKNLVQLASPNYYPKTIKNDMSDEADYLVIQSNIPLSKYEQAILNKSHYLASWENMDFYSLSKEELFSDDRFQVFEHFEKIRDSLQFVDGFFTPDSTHVIFYEDYENLKSDTSFRGVGAFQSSKKMDNILAYFEPGFFQSGKEYDLSIWMFNGEPDALNLWFRLMIEEYDKQSDEWFSTTIFPEHAETIFGDWSLVEGKFRVWNGDNPIQIVTKGKSNSKAAFHADDLLITEVDVDVLRMDDQDKVY